MWDAHIHLDDEQFSADVFEVIQRAKRRGIAGAINPAVSLLSAEKIYILSSQTDGFIYPALGFHPHSAEEVQPHHLQEMERRIREWKPVGIGETGLDWRKASSSRRAQLALFERHLEWAEKFALPLIVHMRDSEETLLEILFNSRNTTGMLHSFSGSLFYSEKFLQLGWYISFSGIVTYPSAEEVRRVAEMAPDDRILLETDAPYLAPQRYRGKRCLPDMLLDTVQFVAKLRKVEPTILAKQTCENLRRLFSLRGEESR